MDLIIPAELHNVNSQNNIYVIDLDNTIPVDYDIQTLKID